MTSFTVPETAGSGINALNFAKYINSVRDKATVLSFSRNCRYPLKTTIEGVHVRRIPYFNKHIILKILSLPIILAFYIFMILKHRIIYIYGGKIIGWQILIAFSRILNRKIVFQALLKGVDDMSSLIENHNIFSRTILKGIIQLIHVYHAINKDFIYDKSTFCFKGGTLVLPQGIDANLFSPINRSQQTIIRNKLNLPPNRFIIVSTGFLISRKGYIEVFKALSILKFDFLYVVLAEKDYDRDHFLYNQRSYTLGVIEKGEKVLEKKIYFAGYRNNVADYMRCGDLFLHNAELEGFPNALLEAMACGIPIIMKKIDGITGNFIQHGEHALVYRHKEEIPDLVDKIYHSPKLRQALGSNARKVIIDHYSFSKIYPQVINKIREIRY